MSEPDKEQLRALRLEVLAGLSRIEYEQNSAWDTLSRKVQVAQFEYLNHRLIILEERIRELAADQERSVLLETFIGALVTFIPIDAIVGGMLTHAARTFELGRVIGLIKRVLPRGARRAVPPLALTAAAQTISLSPPGSPSLRPAWLNHTGLLDRVPSALTAARAETMSFKEFSSKEFFRPAQWTEYIYEAKENSAALQRLGEVYRDEIGDTVRAAVKSAANTIPAPVVSREQMNGTATPPPKPVTSGAPVVGYFDGLLAGIQRSKNANAYAIAQMRDAALAAEDVDALTLIKQFIDQPVFAIDSTIKIDYDSFQLFVEACFWCCTWDFRPHFQAARRPSGALLRGFQPAQLVPPPLGDKFWDYAVKRFRDPFFGDGTKTYAEIPRTRQLGNLPTGFTDPDLESYQAAASKSIDPGLYPAERLAFHFGAVIAPQLLGHNRELALALEAARPDAPPQSRPQELTRFYQAMAQVMQLRSEAGKQ